MTPLQAQHFAVHPMFRYHEINICSRHKHRDLSTGDSSLRIPRGSRDGIRLDSHPEKIQRAPSMNDNREWLGPKLSHQCRRGHFPALHADLCGTHRDNRSEIHLRGPAEHCHHRNNRHGTGTVQGRSHLKPQLPQIER
jgi:hypothetical protein